MEDYYKKAQQGAEYIKSRISGTPDIAIVLGSGLGTLVNDMKDITEIDYRDIPDFPVSTVEGHSGKLVFGELSGRPVIAMKGRFHYYEGYDISQVVFHIRVFKLMGINRLLVTNAAGGVNRSFKPGNLMLIKDHISLFSPSPLRGRNMDALGVRFPDMSEAYSGKLRAAAKKCALELGMEVQEGVYAFTQGPMYETPAEIRALAMLGTDAVGMSTVPEVIAARHAGMEILGISCITNMAAGILKQPLNHEEVVKTAGEVQQKFTSFVRKIVADWVEE